MKAVDKWCVCQECKGQGKKRNRLKKKVKIQYQKNLEEYNTKNHTSNPPIKPRGSLNICKKCQGSGLTKTDVLPLVDKQKFPNVAIIGGGIGGMALAVACLHRGVPFTVYERDLSFNARHQGYGLTLQQASNAIKGLGISSLDDGIISTRHVVHNTKGEIVGEWGMRKWLQSNTKTTTKRTNIHISRQSLRMNLYNQLKNSNQIKWGHQFVSCKKSKDNVVDLTFNLNGKDIQKTADLVVGADGIRSIIREQILKNDTPLRYLDCMVILGICSLESIKNVKSTLLDSATVFQTSNGNERIYMMPYTSDSIMWQLSFPISEQEAKSLNKQGPKALKKEACFRTQWHSPIPDILSATLESQITGYPVYDRDLLEQQLLKSEDNITLIGDAAHPMSPFKGQGANQALLDALDLARSITKGCRALDNWKENGIRKSVLNDFEIEMLKRSSTKVKDSAKAAEFLHTEIALHKSDRPRGKNV